MGAKTDQMLCALQCCPGMGYRQAVGFELEEERQTAWQEWLQEYKAVLKEEGVDHDKRIELQNSVNPCYIPRNHLLQDVIALAENGEYEGVKKPHATDC